MESKKHGRLELKSIEEACRYHGVTYQEYMNRQGKCIYRDHLGNMYCSAKEMCEHYGINDNTYRQRIKYGWSQERALTEKPHDKYTKVGVTDHLGNKYSSIVEMCSCYGISRNLYSARMRLGWSKEEALTVPKGYVNRQSITTDHLGNKYNSTTEMCEHYGIDRMAYTNRLRRGWSQKEALTKKVKVRNKEMTDHLGNVYKSKVEMCKHYGISVSVYDHRTDKGWSQERALTTPMRGGHNNEM